MENLNNKVKGAIYGLLIGDAVGVPYEFKSPAKLPPIDKIDMIPPADFSRTYPTIPIGTWSDDGSQALCLLASLLHCQKLDQDDLMKRFANWYNVGYMAVDNHTFDVGVQTAQAIRNYTQGIAVEDCASNHEQANGNGSLMRTLPLAIWHSLKNTSDEQLIADAYAQSHVTHAHLRSKICCALYCLWAKAILHGQTINDAWKTAVDKLYAMFDSREETGELEELDFFIRPYDLADVSGSGYVVDCLKSAYVALQEDSYEKVIKKAISLGKDTDTTACVAGGIAGLYHGFDNIPQKWVEQLREKETVEPLLADLLKIKS